jgi:hypothetical protein
MIICGAENGGDQLTQGGALGYNNVSPAGIKENLKQKLKYFYVICAGLMVDTTKS